MRLQSSLLLLALSATSTFARPTELNERFLDNVLDTDDLLILDAPGFPDPATGQTLASFQTFVYLRSIALGPLTSFLSDTLSNLGLDVGSQLATFQARVKLFAAIGLPGKKVEVKVDGCSTTVAGTTQHTSFSVLGTSLTTLLLGRCSTGNGQLQASARIGVFDQRTVRATVFATPDSGFGVISDIDDTIKISNVLDTTALLKSTFLDAPKPVVGMPQLYTSLSQSLDKPQFFYVTGSPYQLFPVLSDFVKKEYPAAAGPIFTKNLTVANPVDLVNFFGSSNTREYKGGVIDRLRSFYPNKKWLAIGDSTQQDPEAYADALRKHGASISCVWIRRVDGANNTDARFAEAFNGVPTSRFRTFSDSEMGSLARIDVAGGQC